MIIRDKIAPYWKSEETSRRLEILREQNQIISQVEKRMKGENPDKSIEREALKKISALNEEADTIIRRVEARYIEYRQPEGLLEDIKEILNAFTKEDFEAQADIYRKDLQILKTKGEIRGDLSFLHKLAEKSFDNCFEYICESLLKVQLEGLAGNKRYTEKATTLIENKVSLWYPPSYFPMAHGKGTDALAFMNSKTAETDKITKTSKMEMLEVELRLYKLSANWGIGTDKLWSTAIGVFTAQNDFRDLNKSGKDPKRDVIIPIDKYATLLGYDLLERPTATPEEEKAEKKRIKNQKDNARKAIQKELDTLFEADLSWEEKIKGSVRDFDRIRLTTRAKTKSGNILISISPEIANYLVERNLITQYPAKLLRISGTKPTAYYIGRKLAEYYHIDKNQLRGTNDRIGIPSLLAVSRLPSFEEVQEKDRGHWIERIKEPLEKALDELTTLGVLTDWQYTHAKGVPLTDEEAMNITAYVDFAKLYLNFSLADPIDQMERIETKERARAEAREKRKKKKKN